MYDVTMLTGHTHPAGCDVCAMPMRVHASHGHMDMDIPPIAGVNDPPLACKMPCLALMQRECLELDRTAVCVRETSRDTSYCITHERSSRPGT